MARLGRERMGGASQFVDPCAIDGRQAESTALRCADPRALAVVGGSKSPRGRMDGGSACEAPTQCACMVSGIEFPALSTTITG